MSGEDAVDRLLGVPGVPHQVGVQTAEVVSGGVTGDRDVRRVHTDVAQVLLDVGLELRRQRVHHQLERDHQVRQQRRARRGR